MNMLPDWKDVFKRAWSVKGLTLLTLFGAAQSAFAVIGEPLVGPVWAGAITSLLAAVIIVLRLLAQKEAAEIVGVEDDADDRTKW